jgi:hypothetical protein
MGQGVLAAVGLALWAVSWFVSPHELISKTKEAEDVMRGALAEMESLVRELPSDLGDEGARSASRASNARLDVGYGGPPGWRAFRFSWDLLTGKAEGKGDGNVVKEKILGLTGLTNALMLVALLVVATRGRGGATGMLLLAAVAMNLGWLYLTDAEFRSGLEAGYWMWVGSFALAGIGLVQRDRAARGLA